MASVLERQATSTDSSPRRHGVALALAAAGVSGIAVFVNGEAVGRFPSPTTYTTAKNLVAGSLLLVIAMSVAARRPHHTDERPTPDRRVAWLAVVAVIGGAIPFVLFFEGLARASSTDAAFLHKTLVIWAAILATVVLRERLTGWHVAAIALLVGGHAALTGGLGSLRLGVGEVMILVATLCWAVELVLVKRLLRTVPTPVVAAVRLGGGSVVLVAWLGATARLGELAGLSAAQWAWVALTGSILAAFVSLWFAALARAPVIDVAAILVVGAVVTGVLGIVIGHDPLGDRLTGWVLIAVGAALVAGHAWTASRRHREALPEGCIES